MTSQAPSEAGDPAQDSRAFRRCLGQFATGVTVMTTVAAGKPVGVTANSFASLSLDPPLVLWSIARSSRSFEAYAGARHFAVNVLAADQVGISQHFASPIEDRFAAHAWHPGRHGVPVLSGILAHFECDTEAIHDGGDHAILIGRVTRYARYAGSGLVYAQGRYAVAEDHPSQALEATVPSAGKTAPSDGQRLMGLLSHVAAYSSEAFDAYRQSEGVNLAQSRIVFALGDGYSKLDGIERRSYLSRLSAEDALASLMDRNFVATADGKFSLTASGQALLGKLIGQLDRYESQLFAGLSEADLAATRHVLATFSQHLTRHRPK